MARTREASLDALEQMVDATAASLAQAAASSAYQLFSGREFRRLARFERLSQAEHDRIFNELVIAFLVLIMLLLEAPDLRVADHIHEYLTGLNKRISKAYLDQLTALGVESKHLADWEKLIGMRYEQYARDKHEVRAAALQIESSKKRLDLDGLSKIQMLVPVQAVAIGCHQHVCRNDSKGRDELFKVTLKALSEFYVQVRVRLEGGRITPLTRARVALKRMLDRLRSK
jgi:hypothetical protein